MRENKYRVWDTLLKKYWYGNTDPAVIQGLIFGNPRYEPEQFTGLHDKNGKEIYEGDICVLDILGNARKYNSLKSLTVIISFKNSSYGFEPTHPDMVHKDDTEWRSFWQDEDKELWSEKYFEVIGNIHENPELLK